MGAARQLLRLERQFELPSRYASGVFELRVKFDERTVSALRDVICFLILGGFSRFSRDEHHPDIGGLLLSKSVVRKFSVMSCFIRYPT